MADTPEQQQEPRQEQRQERPKSIRWRRRQERLKRVRDSHEVKRVRVHPRDDVIRRDIKHGGRSFPKQGSVEWPLDSFTKRRLRDGTVRLENEREKTERSEQRAQDRRNGARNQQQRPSGPGAPAPAPEGSTS